MSTVIMVMQYSYSVITDGDGPANTRRWNDVGLLFLKRCRWWTNVKPTLVQRLVSAGRLYSFLYISDWHIYQRFSLNIGLLLGQGCRQWSNTATTKGRLVVLPEIYVNAVPCICISFVMNPVGQINYFIAPHLRRVVVVNHCFTSLFGTNGLSSDIAIR